MTEAMTEAMSEAMSEAMPATTPDGTGVAEPSPCPGPVRRGRPPRAAAQERRQAVLAMAFEEFSQHGFAGACIERIARRAGIGRVSVYRQYGDKAGLFRAATRMRADEVAEQLHQLVRAGPASRQRLRQLVDMIHTAFTTTDLLGTARLVVAEAERFPDVCADLWNTEVQAITVPITQFIAAAQSQGALSSGQPEAAAMHLVNLACGGLRFLIVPPFANPADRAAWLDTVVDFVWPEGPA